MLLTIDAGNTNTVFALYEGNTLAGHWRLSTDVQRTADEYAVLLKHCFSFKNINLEDISGAIISTVVPKMLHPLSSFCQNYCNTPPKVVSTKTLDIGIHIHTDHPEEVGADRLVNAIAAYKEFGGNGIIIDFGTATTFDIINNQGDYDGGIICPGINLSIQALHAAAAKLPDVAIANPKVIIGKNTVEAMQSGIYWGYISMIEGLVSRIQKEVGSEMNVIATGGLAPLFFKATNSITHHSPNLTINGLKLIFDRNKQ
jgi:type III pantothenate kinase